jgi:hypothetical protein
MKRISLTLDDVARIRAADVVAFKADGLVLAIKPPGYDWQAFVEAVGDEDDPQHADVTAFLWSLCAFMLHARFVAGTYVVADTDASPSAVIVENHHVRRLSRIPDREATVRKLCRAAGRRLGRRPIHREWTGV